MVFLEEAAGSRLDVCLCLLLVLNSPLVLFRLLLHRL